MNGAVRAAVARTRRGGRAPGGLPASLDGFVRPFWLVAAELADEYGFTDVDGARRRSLRGEFEVAA